MTKKILRIGGIAIVLGLLAAAAVWAAQAAARPAARAAAPAAADVNGQPSVFIILDRGKINGQTVLQVAESPQLIAWQPGDETPRWAASVGFVYDFIVDAEAGRLILVEQRKAGEDSLQDLRYRSYEAHPPNKDWPLYITQVDAVTGDVLSSKSFAYADLPEGVPYSASLQLLAVQGDRLYLWTASETARLLVYDLRRGVFEDDTWKLCDNGAFPMRVEFSAAAGQVYALCYTYYSGMQARVSVSSLADGSQWQVDIPPLGEEDYMVGNGLALTLDGRLLILDTDAGALAELDLAGQTLGGTVHYRAEASAAAAPWWQRLFGVRTAGAKRWFAFSALSPDGRWLAVDDGIRDGHELRFWLIDLNTLQAVSSVEVPAYPFTAIFDRDNVLWIVMEKRSAPVNSPVLRFDPATGEQAVIQAPLGSWPSEFLLLP